MPTVTVEVAMPGLALRRSFQYMETKFVRKSSIVVSHFSVPENILFVLS